MKSIYIAGPLFNTHERWYLERIAETLENAGYSTFLPHRDAGLVRLGSFEERLRIFEIDIDALNACDLCVALLTGADQDSGTSAELGYMYALGKPCFGITDDKRGALKAMLAAMESRHQRAPRQGHRRRPAATRESRRGIPLG